MCTMLPKVDKKAQFPLKFRLQAKEDLLGGDIVNLEATGMQQGDIVERQGDRVSLTVRRVLKTRKNLFRL